MWNSDDFSFFFLNIRLIVIVLGMNEFYDLCLSVLYRLRKEYMVDVREMFKFLRDFIKIGFL